jgi:hypothetical protein
MSSYPVLLEEDKFTSQASGKLILVVKEVVVQSTWIVRPWNVGSLGVVHVRHPTKQFVRNECQWVGIETGLSGNLTVLNNTSSHFKVSLVMSCNLRLNINDRPWSVAFLDDSGHDSADGIGRKVVIVVSYFAAY